jgi:hypothetical protein
MDKKLEKEDKKGFLFFIPGAGIFFTCQKNHEFGFPEYQEYRAFSNGAS